MPKLSLAFLPGISLALLATIGPASAQAMSPSPVAPASAADPALGRTIIQLYDADQALLADLAKAFSVEVSAIIRSAERRHRNSGKR